MTAPMDAVTAVPNPVSVEYRLHSKLSCFLSRWDVHNPSHVGKASPLPIP